MTVAKTLENMPAVGTEFVFTNDKNQNPCVIINSLLNEYGWCIQFRYLYNGFDNPQSVVWDSYTWVDKDNSPTTLNPTNIKIIGKRYRERPDDPKCSFVPYAREEHGEFVGTPSMLAEILNESHPMSQIPYWGSSNDITIIGMIEATIKWLEHEHEKLPCGENEKTLRYLECALIEQKRRKILRKQQNVTGTQQPHLEEII